MIEVRYHDSVNALRELCHPVERDDARSPFERPDWFALIENTGVKPFIAVARDANGSFAALALTNTGGHIHALRNWYSFTWRGNASAADGGEACLRGIAQGLRSNGHRVSLEPVPNEEFSCDQLVAAFSGAGWEVFVEECDTNHFLDVGGRSFAQYWGDRPGQLRTTLKRKANKVTVEIHQKFDSNIWSKYENIYSKSWKPEEDHPEMLREFARAESEAGRLRLGIAYFEGEPIAAQFWTVENGTAFIHKLAHLEAHKPLSAGTTLSAALFEHVIDADKVDFIDFGTGDEPYKADWMEASRARYRIDCLDPRQPRAWPALVKRKLKRLVQPLANARSRS
ncbi:MAG: GNAT family N-acetyltransferase [Erythrobacter sp.]